MSRYSQAVVAKKSEFSYLETEKSLRETYTDGNKTPYNPDVFPYAKEFLSLVLKRVKDTYAAVVDEGNCELLTKELAAQLKRDFRFDFSDHLGPMRQRDKRGATAKAEENDYNMFHSCYKVVNQAARAKSLGEKFNLSLMSGRVNTDNQTGAEICDPFVFGAPLYLYSKAYPKIVAMTLPGVDTQQKIAQLQNHEKEIKKDMIAQKALAAKELKAQWHFLINKKFMPEGMSFKDLSEDTVKKLSELNKDMLNELSAQVEDMYQKDVTMLKKVVKLMNKQMVYMQRNNTPQEDLAAVQLASLHAMQANDLLKNSSVVQVSIEAEKPIYALMADILENDASLTAKIYDNPKTREVFEAEMKKIHTVKEGETYEGLLDRLVAVNNDKMPSFAKVVGDEYSEKMNRFQMADLLRKGEAMPKVSFMLAVMLLETGAKIEGGSSQIVYANKIKQALAKVFAVAENQPGFVGENMSKRWEVIEKFDYRTAQAQVWGVKANGDVLSYRSLIDGSVKVDDNLLDKVADLPAKDAFDAAAVHRFYSFVTKQQMSDEELSEQKQRVKNNVLQFEDRSDFTRILSPNSVMYKKLANIIRSDANVQKKQVMLFGAYARQAVVR